MVCRRVLIIFNPHGWRVVAQRGIHTSGMVRWHLIKRALSEVRAPSGSSTIFSSNQHKAFLLISNMNIWNEFLLAKCARGVGWPVIWIDCKLNSLHPLVWCSRLGAYDLIPKCCLRAPSYSEKFGCLGLNRSFVDPAFEKLLVSSLLTLSCQLCLEHLKRQLGLDLKKRVLGPLQLSISLSLSLFF